LTEVTAEFFKGPQCITIFNLAYAQQ